MGASLETKNWSHFWLWDPNSSWHFLFIYSWFWSTAGSDLELFSIQYSRIIPCNAQSTMDSNPCLESMCSTHLASTLAPSLSFFVDPFPADCKQYLLPPLACQWSLNSFILSMENRKYCVINILGNVNCCATINPSWP